MSLIDQRRHVPPAPWSVDEAPAPCAEAALVLSAWLRITESAAWLAVGVGSREELDSAGADAVVLGTQTVLATLGGITLRLLGLHLAWERAPGGLAGDYVQPAQLLADPIADSLCVSCDSALTDMREPRTVDRARLRQVVGAAVVCGGYRRLLDQMRSVQAPEDRIFGSYKQALQEYAAKARLAEPEYDYVRSGPQHASIHRAGVRCKGRSAGPAEGSSKRAAEDTAARLWLEAHAAQWLSNSKPQKRKRRRPVPLAQHAHDLRRIGEKLALPPSVDGWLSAALLDRAAHTTPDSYRVASSGLAQLGADVLAVGLMCVQAGEAAQGRMVGDKDLIRNEMLSPERLADHLRGSQLRGAYLPNLEEVPTPRQADALQGVAAVTLVGGADPSLAAAMLVPVGIDLTSALRAGLSEGKDELLHPKSALQEVTSSLGIAIEYDLAETRGPPHAAEHCARVTLVAASGERLAVRGPWAGRRSDAERRAAKLVLRTLDLEPAVLHDVNAAQIAAYMLRHGAEHLRREPAVRIQRARGSLPLLRAWSKRDWIGVSTWLEACELLTDGETQGVWADLLTRTIERGGPIGDPSVARMLQTVVDAVKRRDLEDDQPVLSEDLEECLLDLSDLLSLFSRPRRRRSIAEIVEEIQLLQAGRRRLRISGDLAPQIIERVGATAGVIHTVLRRVLDAEVEWSLDVRRKGRHLVLGLSSSRPIGERAVFLHFHTLLRGDMPLVELRTKADGVELTWLADPPAALDLVLVSGGPMPVAETLASRLHDFKNALAAHDAALSRPTATSTDRRLYQYEASTHLDSAREISQLVLSSGGLRAIVDDEQLFDLGALLSGYATQLVARRPQDVAVDVPAYPTIEVNSSPSLLRTVLDNLVKNALEAMSDGGRLSITLRTTPKLAICVTDTGVGIDVETIERIRSGRAAPSSKRGGSGLGLATVLTVARRLGARLEVESRPGLTVMILEMEPE